METGLTSTATAPVVFDQRQWHRQAKAAARRNAARDAAQQGAARPLLVVMDCKGGPDARAKAARTTRLLTTAGAPDVRTWPDQASVSLLSLPPRELAVTLLQLLD